MIDCGKSLRTAMAQSNMKSIDLASQLGITPQQVAVWRRSKSTNLNTVCKLATVFNMKVTEFLALGED